ncbi:hypothetical protein KKF61_08015 [Patescibacteria group bacterium]|nr:hypothetical protein [Patescibacteria group bacterium]
MSLLQQTLDQFELDDRLKLAPEREDSDLVKAMAKLLTILLDQLEKENEGLPVPKKNPGNKLGQPIPYPS